MSQVGSWLCLGCMGAVLSAQASNTRALPAVPDLLREVQARQKQLETVRETYTYSSLQIKQDIDGTGKVTKTESTENEDFFVNGHVIERVVKKNGQPLSVHDEQKESERVQKLVEKAQKTPPSQPLEGPTISISRILEIMNVGTPRLETYRGRPTIVFDFIGRRDAKTHGLAEDASKKLQGTIWIDEADREVAHMEVTFIDNFHVAGGLLANVQKGSNFQFDQAPVEGGLWLPTGGEGTLAARVLLFKNMRQHFTERIFGYKRFRVDTMQQKDGRALPSD